MKLKKLTLLSNTFLLLFGILLTPITSHAVSFNCTNASSIVEKKICADEQIKFSFTHALSLHKTTNNIYKPIEILEKAGVKKYLANQNNSSEMYRNIAHQYGAWLSQTLDKYDITKHIFDSANIDKNNNEVKTALTLAKVKECYLKSICKANKNDIQKVFGVQNIISKKINIEISPVDELYFIDDKIYVSRYGEGRIGISIYDIKTLKHMKDIYLHPEKHKDFQDNVTNILDTKNQVILKIFARYNTKRDNFIVINKKDFSLQCRGRTTINLEKLSYDNNNICECFDENSTCTNKEPKSNQHKLKNKINHKEKIIANSTNYIITSTQWSEYKLHFYPIDGNKDNEPKQSMRHTDLYVLEGTDQIVYSDLDINSNMSDKVKFGFYDIKKNINRTLFYEKRKPNYRYPHSVVYKNLLIIGAGHDLFIYNFKMMKFVAYDLNFITEEVTSHIDKNRIADLYIYKDKLFIKTFSGSNSRVVDLKNLDKLK